MDAAMKLNTTIDDRAVVAKFNKLPDAVTQKMVITVKVLSEQLRDYIVRNKLNGQVLKRVTGALGRSIATDTQATATGAVGTVFSSGDVKYAAIQEFGGKTSPHVIMPVKAQALSFMMGGKQVFFRKVNHPGSVIPERSYMRSSLADMKQDILDTIALAAGEAVNG